MAPSLSQTESLQDATGGKEGSVFCVSNDSSKAGTTKLFLKGELVIAWSPHGTALEDAIHTPDHPSSWSGVVYLCEAIHNSSAESRSLKKQDNKKFILQFANLFSLRSSECILRLKHS